MGGPERAPLAPAKGGHVWVACAAVAAVLVVGAGSAVVEHVARPPDRVTRTTIEGSDPSPPPTDPAETASPPGGEVSGAAQLYPLGPPPRTGLVIDGTYLPPAGEPGYALPSVPDPFRIVAVTRFDDGLLAADDRSFESTNGLSLVTAQETTSIQPCTTGAGTTNTDRSLAAWATSPCPESSEVYPATVNLREADGTIRSQEVETLPDSNGIIYAAGILGGEVIVNRIFDQGAFITDLDDAPRPIPGVLGVASVNEAQDTVAAALDTGRSGVVDPSDGQTYFTISNRRFLGDFSPDGKTVVAQGSGARDCASVWFLDAGTGAELASITGPARFCIQQTVWEDDTHLLVMLTAREQALILRVGIDGTVERAGEVYSGRTALVE